VWLLCLLGGAVSLALCLTVFRHGSINNDEGVYLQQASLLRHGHLTLRPVPGQVDASQPWLFALRDGAYAGKYLPLVPGLYALGLLLTGSVVPVLVLMSALLPLLTWRLGVRCGLTPERAAWAAAVTLSPLAMVQGALVLSYVPFLLLLLVAWERALAHAAGATSRLGLAVLGATSAAALSARPFDAVVLLGPVLVWALRRSFAALPWVALGALPPSVATLAYTWAVTGSPVRLPFGLLEPRDSLGFGARKLYPEDVPHRFGVAESAEAAWRHFLLGGAAWTLLAVALLALLLARPPRGVRIVALASLALPVTYLAFWGPYSASVLWGGTSVIGPFYALPLLPAIALLVASARPSRLLAGAVALGLLVNAATAANALYDAAGHDRRTDTILRLADAHGGPLLVDSDPPYLGHPVSALRNDGRDAPVLVASVLDPAGLAGAVERAALLQLPGDTYRGAFAYSLREVVPYAAAEPVLVVRRTGAAGEVLVVERGGRRWACRVDVQGVRLRLTAGGVSGCEGGEVPASWGREPYRGCATDECVTLAFHRLGRLTGWRRVVVGRAPGGGLLVPVDGPVVEQRGRGWVEITRGE
jgi:hypothetical protein